MFQGKRLNANGAYELLQEDGQMLASFRFPNATWQTKGTLSERSGDPFKINPVMEMEGLSYCFRRELMNPKGFSPHYKIVADSTQEQNLIEADCPPGLSATIAHQADSYQLNLESRWKYQFTLLRGGRPLARFRDRTSFFTLSARRDYALETLESIPPLLLSFSFFISVCKAG